jgi:hypothetical protein
METKEIHLHWRKPSNKYSNEYKTVYVNACGYKSTNFTEEKNRVTCKTCLKKINEEVK